MIVPPQQREPRCDSLAIMAGQMIREQLLNSTSRGLLELRTSKLKVSMGTKMIGPANLCYSVGGTSFELFRERERLEAEDFDCLL